MKYKYKNEVMILAGQLIAIPFVMLLMIEWIKIDAEPIDIVVLITALIMILLSVTIQISKVANMIGKES